MDKDSKGRPLFSVVRIIEYHGTQEWIDGTFAGSRIPVQGESKVNGEGKPLPEGCSIKSGLVHWDVVPPEVDLRGDVIPIPPGSGRTN